MTKLQTAALCIALVYGLLAACSKKQAEEAAPTPPDLPGTTVTYTAVIGPLFEARCAGCHAAGRQAAARWTFNGFSTVTANAARIRNVVLVTKSMPVGAPLSATELKAVQDWFDQGSPE
jgi:hypothetical protein